jgi:hypothetical protein
VVVAAVVVLELAIAMLVAAAEVAVLVVEV